MHGACARCMISRRNFCYPAATADAGRYVVVDRTTYVVTTCTCTVRSTMNEIEARCRAFSASRPVTERVWGASLREIPPGLCESEIVKLRPEHVMSSRTSRANWESCDLFPDLLGSFSRQDERQGRIAAIRSCQPSSRLPPPYVGLPWHATRHNHRQRDQLVATHGCGEY